MRTLNFEGLRAANRARVGQFKNSKGEPAHTQPDGSDWSPAQWLQATMGELGEYAMERCRFEAGEITAAEFAERASKEIADFTVYTDLLSMRALDHVPLVDDAMDAAQMLQWVVANIGLYCNERKKFDRGDVDLEQLKTVRESTLKAAMDALQALLDEEVLDNQAPNQVHPTGVDLGLSTQSKFNEVSKRVGSSIHLSDNGLAYEWDADVGTHHRIS